MSLKKFVAALALSSVAAFAWLGLSAAPAAAAPQAELKQLDQDLGLHAKKLHKKGLKHATKGAKKGVKKLHNKGLKRTAKATANSRVQHSAKAAKSAKTGGKKHHGRHHKKSKKS